MRINPQASADVVLLVVSLLAAAGWIFSKEALAGLEPVVFVGVRFLSAALVVALVGRVALGALSRDQVLRATLTGTILGLQLLLWIFALRYASHLGVGAFLASMGFVLAPIMGRIFFGARSTLFTWIALVIAVIGLIFLMLDDSFTLSGTDTLFLASAVAAAFHFNLSNHFMLGVPAMPSTVIQLGVVGIFAFVCALALQLGLGASLGADLLSPDTQWQYGVLGWLAASVLLATCLRYFLFIAALKSAPLGHGAVIMTLEPVWAALLAAAWYGERMTLEQTLGCGLIFSALLVSFYGRRRGSSRKSQRSRQESRS